MIEAIRFCYFRLFSQFCNRLYQKCNQSIV